MIVWLIDWKWLNSKLLKVKWEGIKRLSQTFIFAFWSPWIQILFNTKPRREDDMTSSIYLNDKGCWKYLNFIWKIFPTQELYATQLFSWEKIKWLLQLYEIWVGSQKESNWKSFESILKLPFKFGIIWILFKLFFS